MGRGQAVSMPARVSFIYLPPFGHCLFIFTFCVYLTNFMLYVSLSLIVFMYYVESIATLYLSYILIP